MTKKTRKTFVEHSFQGATTLHLSHWIWIMNLCSLHYHNFDLNLVLHPQQYPWLNTYFWFGHYMVCSKGPALILVQQGWYYLKWLPSKYWYKGVGTSQCLFLLNSGQHMVVCLQLATTTGLQHFDGNRSDSRVQLHNLGPTVLTQQTRTTDLNREI